MANYPPARVPHHEGAYPAMMDFLWGLRARTSSASVSSDTVDPNELHLPTHTRVPGTTLVHGMSYPGISRIRGNIESSPG